MEREKNGKFHFFDIAIQRREEGIVQRSVYRKDDVDLSFNTLCTVSYNTAVIKTLFHRMERICTTDTLEAELKNVKECPKDHRCPKEFTEKYGKSRDKTP